MRVRLLFLFFSISILSFAQKNHPKPDKTSALLFYVQHNLNYNTYVYELNMENGSVNSSDPVKVYRMNYEDKGQKENLTLIQRRYAYGINYMSDDKTKFNLSANKAIPMVLKTNDKQSWVEIVVNNNKIILEKIFIQSDKKTKGLKTKVESIIFYGKDGKGNLIQEKYIP
jgi:hypothetical protein